MNILAVDQARNGAWSVFHYESKTLIGFGTFSFDAKKYTYARAILHIDELIGLVIQAYDVSAVFIEDINLRANVQAFKKLAQLQGVLVNSFERNEYLYEIIAPSKWQNYCMARGRNTKEADMRVLEVPCSDRPKTKILSIQFVKEKFGIETENDNLADAICIGYYAVNEIALCREGKNSRKSSGMK